MPTTFAKSQGTYSENSCIPCCFAVAYAVVFGILSFLCFSMDSLHEVHGGKCIMSWKCPSVHPSVRPFFRVFECFRRRTTGRIKKNFVLILPHGGVPRNCALEYSKTGSNKAADEKLEGGPSDYALW
jgi:hypothetical protein